MPKTIIASGYFLIYHAGHEEYLRKAKALGDRLIVIVNNDQQQVLKYGKIIVPFKQRMAVMSSIKHADLVITSIDQDETVNITIKFIKEIAGANIFAKGGDRIYEEIPERETCDQLGIDIVDGLGEKIQSASELLQNFAPEKT